MKGDNWLADNTGDQRCSDLGCILKVIVCADRLDMSMRERAAKDKSKIFHRAPGKMTWLLGRIGKAEDGVGGGKEDHTLDLLDISVEMSASRYQLYIQT